jgi:hypothetical protein
LILLNAISGRVNTVRRGIPQLQEVFGMDIIRNTCGRSRLYIPEWLRRNYGLAAQNFRAAAHIQGMLQDTKLACMRFGVNIPLAVVSHRGYKSASYDLFLTHP